jgi:hypothetical protein
LCFRLFALRDVPNCAEHKSFLFHPERTQTDLDGKLSAIFASAVKLELAKVLMPWPEWARSGMGTMTRKALEKYVNLDGLESGLLPPLVFTSRHVRVRMSCLQCLINRVSVYLNSGQICTVVPRCVCSQLMTCSEILWRYRKVSMLKVNCFRIQHNSGTTFAGLKAGDRHRQRLGLQNQ